MITRNNLPYNHITQTTTNNPLHTPPAKQLITSPPSLRLATTRAWIVTGDADRLLHVTSPLLLERAGSATAQQQGPLPLWPFLLDLSLQTIDYM
jgi:hypothetical protein